VRFVPLIGEEGWEAEEPAPETTRGRIVQARPTGSQTLPGSSRASGGLRRLRRRADLDGLLDRIGDARVVLIGEASHGTSEFYRLRARHHPAADRGARASPSSPPRPTGPMPPASTTTCATDVKPAEWTAFARFPTWMWRNRGDPRVRRLAARAQRRAAASSAARLLRARPLQPVQLGRAVIDYLDDVDPSWPMCPPRYGCLSPWETDPAAYGHAALTGRYRHCEDAVVGVLGPAAPPLAARRARRRPVFDAEQNARVVAQRRELLPGHVLRLAGERGTCATATCSTPSSGCWRFHGEGAKAVVWAHNSHIGDARATEMSARGEHNIGQLCVQAFGDDAYRIGFGTDRGTVAAASHWDGPWRSSAWCRPTARATSGSST
jgi:erythromycin esterase-like protein